MLGQNRALEGREGFNPVHSCPHSRPPLFSSRKKSRSPLSRAENARQPLQSRFIGPRSGRESKPGKGTATGAEWTGGEAPRRRAAQCAHSGHRSSPLAHAHPLPAATSTRAADAVRAQPAIPRQPSQHLLRARRSQRARPAGAQQTRCKAIHRLLAGSRATQAGAGPRGRDTLPRSQRGQAGRAPDPRTPLLPSPAQTLPVLVFREP